MTALIAFGMFPAVTLLVAGLARAERNLSDAGPARVPAERPIAH